MPLPRPNPYPVDHLATAQMSSVSGPFSHAAGTGTLQQRAGPLLLRYRRVDLLLGPDLCCFVLAGVAITSTPAWGLAPQLRRHLRRRRRTALPGTPWPATAAAPRGILPGHHAGRGELGNTSIQQLNTRPLHATRGRRLNVSFPVAAADRSVAGADLAQRADGGAAPPPDQGAQGAGVLVADRRGDGVDCLAGRAEQEGRLIQPDLMEEVDR
jgi:hypothetical protein